MENDCVGVSWSGEQPEGERNRVQGSLKLVGECVRVSENFREHEEEWKFLSA
jgi:hypothetical protein